jgi:hypothetical protein
MLSKSLFLGVLAATSLSISGASAATTVLWDFSTGTPGDLGPQTIQDSVPLSIPIAASAYERPLVSTSLFRTQGAGLGLAGPSVDNEISGRGFIQLDLLALTAPPLRNLDVSFSFNSVTSGDEWAVWVQKASGTHGETPILTGTDEGIHFINTMCPNGPSSCGQWQFLDVGVVRGSVLLHTLDAELVPEPSTWAMMLLGFAGLGFVGYRQMKRRAKPQAA